MALFPSGFMPALRNNSDTLLQTGIGLIGGRTASEQASMGLQGFAQGRKQNQTINFLRKNSPELAAAVESGALSGGDAYKMFYQKKLEAEKPAQLSFQTLPDGTYGFANPKDGTFDALGQAVKPGGGDELGLNLVWGRNEKGETVAYQPSKSGGLVPVEVSEGVQLSDPYYRARDAASGKVAGTTQGEAAAQVPGTRVAAEQVSQQVESLKNDPYLPRMLGPFDSRLPSVTADSARVQGKIDQLKGGAFLQARQMLKGGGAITDFEGQKAEAAFARMNTAQSEEDFKAALDEFNYYVQQGLSKLEAQAGVGGGQQPAQGGAVDPLGIR